LNVYVDMMRKLTMCLICVGLSCGLSGCHRKAKAVVLPQAQAPVVLAPPPASVDEVMVEAPPVYVPPAPIAAAASKPKRERKKPSVPKVVPATVPTSASTQTAPVQVASAGDAASEGTAIGALTAGGEATSQTRQDALDLIAANEKRLNELSPEMLREKKSQINKIRNFERQAQEALSSGDAEGAKTLATKARLLIFDLDRPGGE
jgi:hypothetical protein